MKEKIEIETRNLLTAEQYFSLCSYFLNQVGRRLKHLTLLNYYFDDDNYSLTKNNCVLRLRFKNNKSPVLTLKIQQDANKCLEISEKLTHIDVENLLNKNVLPKNIIIKLQQLGFIPYNLKTKGKLKNQRMEVDFETYLVVIDKNEYNDTIDYDIEIESSDINIAKIEMDKLLKLFNIEKNKDYIVKSKRVMNKF